MPESGPLGSRRGSREIGFPTAIATGRLRIVQGAGHFIQNDRPQIVARRHARGRVSGGWEVSWLRCLGG